MTIRGLILIGIYAAGFILAAYNFKRGEENLNLGEWMMIFILSLFSWLAVGAMSLGMQMKEAIREAEEYKEEPPYRDFGKDVQSR